MPNATSDQLVIYEYKVSNDLNGWVEVIQVLMVMVGASGGHQERRFGDRRKLDEKAVGISGASLVLSESVMRDRVSVSADNHREEGRRHRRLLVWDQDGNCREGKTPCFGKAMMFIESTWMAPIGSDITISLVPAEEELVGQELAKGKVVWHCPQGDEFGNQEGFGVLFQQQRPQSSGPDTVRGPKEGV